MGLGGDTTVLPVHVEQAHTHITLNPVAINYQCWAARRASAHINADGTIDYDREAVMAHHEITFPTDEADRARLRAGDTVTIQGHIIGIRDATQIRIFDQGVEPPIVAEGAALLHTAPNVRKLGPRPLRADVHRHHHQRPHEPLHRGPDRATTAPARSSARAGCCRRRWSRCASTAASTWPSSAAQRRSRRPRSRRSSRSSGRT